MKPNTIVVVGGGYAGLHAMEALRKEWRNTGGRDVRFVLLDRNTFHFKKVLLVKAPFRPVDLRMPFDSLGWNDVDFVQGSLTHINSADNKIHYRTEEGVEAELPYDRLVLTIGSVVKEPDPACGGIPLSGEHQAIAIQSELAALIRRAHQVSRTEREKLLKIAVIGGGISGIETASELAAQLRTEASAMGLPHLTSHVSLIHAGKSLFPEGPDRVSRQLERKLARLGVKIVLETKALRFDKDSHILHLEKGQIPTALCIWTLGLQPSPLLKHLGLPLHQDGRLMVDASYRVNDTANIYAIGDCAHVFDPNTGRVDALTCKEAIPQGQRLASVIKADMLGSPAPLHKSYPVPTFAIGLGPQNGFVWTRKWGIDFVVSGKLGGKVKEYAWKFASAVK